MEIFFFGRGFSPKKKILPVPLDRSERVSKKMETGVVLDALFENNPMATIFYCSYSADIATNNRNPTGNRVFPEMRVGLNLRGRKVQIKKRVTLTENFEATKKFSRVSILSE